MSDSVIKQWPTPLYANIGLGLRLHDEKTVAVVRHTNDCVTLGLVDEITKLTLGLLGRGLRAADRNPAAWLAADYRTRTTNQEIAT